MTAHTSPGPTFDETVELLDHLMGQRVSVAIFHSSGAKFAALHGMLRWCEPQFIEQSLAEDPGEVAAFYVDGGQAGGELPAVVLHRLGFGGLPPDDSTSPAIGWFVGHTITTVLPDEETP